MSKRTTSPSWYEHTGLVALLCVLLFPIGLYGLWKNSTISRSWKLGVTLLIILALGGIWAANREPAPSDASSAPEAAMKEEAGQDQRIRDMLRHTLDTLETAPFDGSAYRSDVQAIQREAAIFGLWCGLALKAERSGNPEIVQLSMRLTEKVRSLQTAEFPEMRKAYGEAIREQLKAQRISVQVSGEGYRTLELSGDLFARDKPREDLHMAIADILAMLRFKQVDYRAATSAPPVSTVAISCPNDGDIVEMKIERE